MSSLTLAASPSPIAVEARAEPQVCYVLVSLHAAGDGGTRPVNWSLVADASRSMRIPIVGEEQFRELLRSGAAQETLVDGVPVWQLSGPVPPEVRDSAPSALDHVGRALHTVVERLGADDRFSLVVFADEARLLTRSSPGSARAALVHGIERLPGLDLGDETDLAAGMALGLEQLRAGRDGRRAERLLLLTDGFTRRPADCLALADQAAAERVACSTIGLGGEFQEDLLTALADRSGGRAIFLSDPAAIPRAVSAELAAARTAAMLGVTLRLAIARKVTLRRVTRVRPALTVLLEPDTAAPDVVELPLGDLTLGAPTQLLLELLLPPVGPGRYALAVAGAWAAGVPVAELDLTVAAQHAAPPLAPDVRAAAARSAVARLQRRATTAAAAGQAAEAARLLEAAAARLDELGERALAAAAREHAATIARTGRAPGLATKELTYATRRLGGDA